MSKHDSAKSPPPVTYSARPPLVGATFACTRCRRVHAYPADGEKPIRCECGWWYQNVRGLIREEFKPRLGV